MIYRLRVLQAQILNLLAQLQREFGISYLFITHNIGVVEYIANDVVVMQKGRVEESVPADLVLSNPQSGYTRSLLAARGGAAVGAVRPRALRAARRRGLGAGRGCGCTRRIVDCCSGPTKALRRKHGTAGDSPPCSPLRRCAPRPGVARKPA